MLLEKPSALREHTYSSSKYDIFLYFCGSFLSWIRIRIQELKLMRIRGNPDSKLRINSIRTGYIVDFVLYLFNHLLTDLNPH
jgi:hypothetical protein